jgi:hypothetical protein
MFSRDDHAHEEAEGNWVEALFSKKIRRLKPPKVPRGDDVAS